LGATPHERRGSGAERSEAERDYAQVPHAKIVAIPGAGHSPMIEKPYATARLLLGFARHVPP